MSEFRLHAEGGKISMQNSGGLWAVLGYLVPGTVKFHPIPADTDTDTYDMLRRLIDEELR